MRSFICGMPKAELHVHLEGTLEPELALALAERNRVRLRFASVEDLRAAYRFSDLQSFLDLYYEMCATLVTGQDFADLTSSYLRRAAADGVRHAEVFFDPQSHIARGVPLATVIEGIHQGLERGRREHGVSSLVILCFLRHLNEPDAVSTLESALPFKDRIAGVGLDSTEVGNPPSKFARVFERARREGFRVVAHAGEEGPPGYVRQALDLLGAERIDHGVRAIEDPELLARLAREQVPLTVCPLSNVRLRVFPTMRDHNLKRLLDAGLLVTINSDDPAYFGGYITDNYRAIAAGLRLSVEDLLRLAANAIEGSFASD
ncbi:MAG TPA: adenosine deaminase, partial [Candidatus Bathyarchaeia archaeon]|nr:adenosine deaminase [Candidatus Bathyarchaeia archaeon]